MQSICDENIKSPPSPLESVCTRDTITAEKSSTVLEVAKSARSMPSSLVEFGIERTIYQSVPTLEGIANANDRKACMQDAPFLDAGSISLCKHNLIASIVPPPL